MQPVGRGGLERAEQAFDHGRGILHQVERAREDLGRLRGGLAGRVASSLSKQGFDTKAATADSYDYSTTRIIYVGEENKAKAQAVAKSLGLSNVRADDGTYSGEADVVVVLGQDMANN